MKGLINLDTILFWRGNQIWHDEISKMTKVKHQYDNALFLTELESTLGL